GPAAPAHLAEVDERRGLRPERVAARAADHVIAELAERLDAGELPARVGVGGVAAVGRLHDRMAVVEVQQRAVPGKRLALAVVAGQGKGTPAAALLGCAE